MFQGVLGADRPSIPYFSPNRDSPRDARFPGVWRGSLLDAIGTVAISTTATLQAHATDQVFLFPQFSGAKAGAAQAARDAWRQSAQSSMTFGGSPDDRCPRGRPGAEAQFSTFGIKAHITRSRLQKAIHLQHTFIQQVGCACWWTVTVTATPAFHARPSIERGHGHALAHACLARSLCSNRLC